MSRRAAPDSPWQNGMPPFGLCQQQFNPMMNCGPMWAQPSLPFMGGSMAPDMMRFGGNVSSRSNFRRNYDQPDRYSRPRQPYGDRSGNRPSSYGGRGGDRKRPAPGHRSRSPAAKKAKRVDRKPEQGKPKGAEADGEDEEQDEAGPSAELYDPAEPTSEDAGDGVEQAEGNEDDESGAAQQDETTDGGDGEADAENDESAPQDEIGDTRPARNATFDRRSTGSQRGAEFMTDSASWGPRRHRDVWEHPTSRRGVASRAFPDSRRHDERNAMWGLRRHRHVWEHTTARHLVTSRAFPDSRRHERNAPSASTSTMMLEGRRGRYSHCPPQQQQQQWHFNRMYHRSCSQDEGKPGPSKPAGKPGAKSGGGAAKASESKSSGGRPGDKDGAARSDKEQGAKRGGPRGKGWCTVCELNFEGNFLDHRRTEEHKTKRDEKYPKCHPCSMGFNNRVQYEQHCAGDFHRKNVEVLDNEVDETAGPLGEEYLEEVPAFFCTLCKILLKADLKKQHCCTQGHYRRHRDVKRKEEAALKAKLAKEKQADDEDEDVSQMAFTVTDEILSDDEAKAASEAPGESSKQVKVEEPAEVPTEDLLQEQQDGEPETPMEEEEVPGAEPKAEEEQPEPDVQVKTEQVKAEPKEGVESTELHEVKAEEEAAAQDDSDEAAIPDTNGCKSTEEEGDEQQQQAPPATPAPKTAARPLGATAKTAPAPKALKAPAKATSAPAKVPHKSVLAAKAAATPKPLAKPMSVTPKPAAAAPKPATRIPAAKAGTAVTSAPAATAAAAPGKKPAAPAAASEPSAAAGVGGMARGRGRGATQPKAVRGVGTRKR